MNLDQLLTTLWRRKWIGLVTVVLMTAATYVFSQSLPKVYSAEARLFVENRDQAGSDYEAVQGGQVLARTYAELIQSKNVAERVVDRLAGDATAEEVLARVTFQAVSGTQLIVISAEGGTPRAAAALANAYADVFSDYVASNLRTTRGRVTVADRASPPAAPVRPRPKLYAAVMAVFSLFLGAGLALLRERFDTRLGKDEEITRVLELPILARVPSIGRQRRDPRLEQGFLEAYRVLRTNLTFLRPREPLSSVLITSAAALEGKSTSAFSLARVIAEQGRRVIVIEGDIRRPALRDLYGLDGAEGGLTHYFALGYDFDRIVYETPFPNVRLVPAGPAPPNPSALIEIEAAKRLVADAAERADFVIVDSPPVSAAADASILAHAVEGVVFVVNRRRSRRPRTIAAVRQLTQAGANIVGLIVNQAGGVEDYGTYYGTAQPASDLESSETATSGNGRRSRRPLRRKEKARSDDA